MSHKRHIIIQPGEAYTFRVTVADVAGASLTFADLGGDTAQQINAGETIEVRVEARPKPAEAQAERRVA